MVVVVFLSSYCTSVRFIPCAFAQHDFIGGCEANIGSIVGAAAGKYVADLKRTSDSKVHGKIHVVAEENSGVKGKVRLQFRSTVRLPFHFITSDDKAWPPLPAEVVTFTANLLPL